MPQAYLAPPQPGQPKYGTPARPARVLAVRQPGPVRPRRRSLRAFGQSGHPQQGYGRPASARGAFAVRRDPAIAAPWERLAATVIDWIIIFAIPTLAFISPLEQISRQMQAVHAHYADLYSPDAQAAIDAILRDPSNQRALLFWFVAMFGIALAYYWVQHAAWGATIGKRALGTRVVKAADQLRDRNPGGRDPGGSVPSRPGGLLVAAVSVQLSPAGCSGWSIPGCRCLTRAPSACTTSSPGRS